MKTGCRPGCISTLQNIIGPNRSEQMLTAPAGKGGVLWELTGGAPYFLQEGSS